MLHSLYWQVVVVNGAVLGVAVTALVLSPATVSRSPVMAEVLVVGGGLLVLLVANALLLRSLLRPIDRLAQSMAGLDLSDETRPVPTHGVAADLIGTFNAMVARLERERDERAAHALAAQEAERARIAQELHDEVGQELTAVLLVLSHLVDRSPPDVRPEVEQLLESVRSSLSDVRSVVTRLRPGALEELGLLSALNAMATDIEQLGRWSVDRTLTRELPTLRPDQETVLYRVAQEALTNVVRHASARRIWLWLTPTTRGVELGVADDGVGLVDSTPGTGLRGMQERAALVGAALSIDGDTSGTTIRLRVPVVVP